MSAANISDTRPCEILLQPPCPRRQRNSLITTPKIVTQHAPRVVRAARSTHIGPAQYTYMRLIMTWQRDARKTRGVENKKKAMENVRALECSAEGKDVQAEVKRLLLEIWEMARAASDQPESSESLDKRVTELLEVELEGLREEDRVAMGVLNEQKRGLEELQAQNRRKMPAFCLKIYASLSQSRISFVISGSDHRSRLRKCLEFLDDNIRTTPTCFTYALSLRLLSLAFVTDNIPSFTFTTVRMT